jgi:hypothetical protein
MSDHVVFGVSHCEESEAFFHQALAALGVALASEGPLGAEPCRQGSQASLCICRAEARAARLHLAFAADNRQQVDAFHRAALEAGAQETL